MLTNTDFVRQLAERGFDFVRTSKNMTLRHQLLNLQQW